LDSIVLAPVYTGKGLYGVMALAGIDGKTFDEMADLLRLIVNTIGNALGYAELNRETRKQINQLSIINELSRAITSIHDPREILDALAERIAVLMSVKRCLIRIVEDDMLRIVSVHGPLDSKSLLEAIPVGKGIAGWVAKEGKPMIVDDARELSSEMNFPPLTSSTALSVPLLKEGRVIGTLGLYDKLDENGKTMPFTPNDMVIAEGIATITAIALESAMIQEEHDREAEERLRSQKRLNLLFESAQSGIVSLDREFTVKSANKYVERWTNLPVNEIVGKNALDVFHSREGICPHCAAKTTLEDGEVNSITQSVGLNYAELSAYPVFDDGGETTEAIIFIQDITDRVMYQEEIMGLYREVVQNKEYIESFISNSADAIITTDTDGNVISWNPAAESIYGFNKDEVLGKPIPHIPEDLVANELESWEKIRKGDVVTLETYRKRKDGRLIETSLTMSPIKDVSGEIIGMSSISRDITERRRVEKELIRRNQELSRLFFISSATRGTLDLDVLIRMILSAVTMGDGLGFNRAILFLYEPEEELLKAYLGVGPSTQEEANKIWEELSHRDATLHETLREIENGGHLTESFLDKVGKDISIPTRGDNVLVRVFKERRPLYVDLGNKDIPPDDKTYNRR
jgi:PAS domain S-box-containing protein